MKKKTTKRLSRVVDDTVYYYEKDGWGRCIHCDCNMSHTSRCPIMERRNKISVE